MGLPAIYRNEVIVTKTDPAGMAISSSSQPAIMAIMLERLDLRVGQRVLEIGTGTGYNTALLGSLVTSRRRVVSVELDRDLARLARSRLHQGGHRARVVPGDGRDGWQDSAPYDRIIATASVDAVPRAWFDQLSGDGLVEVPLRLTDIAQTQAVVTFRKVEDHLESAAAVWGGFMPMRAHATDSHPLAASISLSWTLGAKRQTVAVMGDAIRRLAPSARRRLVALMAEEPRRLPLGLRPSRGRHRDLPRYQRRAKPRDLRARQDQWRGCGQRRRLQPRPSGRRARAEPAYPDRGVG